MHAHATLVVDDDRLTRESVCEVLDDLGLRARDAVNGMEAIRILAQDPFDLVVSDVDMPDLSGFELIERLIQLRLTMPVVLMSGRADQDLDQTARDAGAITLLHKPLSIEPFRGLVRSILDL